MDAAELTTKLKLRARELGFSLSGVAPAVPPPGAARLDEWLERGYAGQMHYLADRRAAYADPRHVLEGARSILMLAMDYRTAEPEPTEPGEGRVSRYAWGTADYHDVIHQRLAELADQLREWVPASRVRGVVDTAPLLEREFAQLAGLGWIGKHTLLINRDRGSWFFLAALLTDVELIYDQPHETDHCGTCRACLDACPTGAFPQAYVLDASRCISYLTIELRAAIPAELRPGIGDWLFGCDVCQEVCPWNSHATRSQMNSASRVVLDPGRGGGGHPAHDFAGCRVAGSQATRYTLAEFEPLPENNPVELAQLFELDDAAFRARFRHTPLWRPKRRGLLRNAAIVLGNHPTPAVLPALVKGLNDPEPLVRAACAWALGHYAASDARPLLQLRRLRETATGVLREIDMALDRLDSDPRHIDSRHRDDHLVHFGCMSTTTVTTADELLALSTGMGNRYELIAGELRVMSPSGWRHGKVVGKLHNRLGHFIEQHDLGVVFGAETGFRLASDPDTVRAPDVSFISKQKLPEQEPGEGFWPGAPDLAVEVLSPGDRTGEVDEKIDAWLSAGCNAVWVVDPRLKTVTIYRSHTQVEVKTTGDVLRGDPVVPGFSCAVDELFR